MNKFILILTAVLSVSILPAIAHSDSMGSMQMSGKPMTMSSSVDLADPMSKEASGTAWLPESSPMYGKMTMLPNGNMLMLHGAAMPRYTDVGSKRGDRRFDAPNWFMGMLGHPLTTASQIGLRAMFSLDPITEGGYGYPLLFQTGEKWHNLPLHDRQHPHDLFDELSATYSRRVGAGNSVYLYAADPGEPALGPPTYMHRLLAYDYADAPIGHHWQDSTHITFGVVTAGINFGSKIKIEGSDFTGREPDQNRYNFDKPRWDSHSGRLSYNPDKDDSFQVSYGFINYPEGDGANVHRTTASWLYNRPLGSDTNFTTAVIWGQNDLSTEGLSNSYLAEADYQRGKDTLFTRIENIQKSGNELVLPSPFDTSKRYLLGRYVVGYVRDLKHGKGIDTGIGFAVGVDTKPSDLNPFYGNGTPVDFQVYLRFRASRAQSGMGMQMSGMDMSESAVSSKTKSSIDSISMTITPNQPKAASDNALVLTLSDKDGKPVTGAKIESSVAMTTMDMGTSHPAFQDMGDGTYKGEVTFAMAGPWRVTIAATPGDGSVPKTVSNVYAVGM